MEKYNNVIQDASGDIVTTATVTVYLAGTGTPATLYEDDEIATYSNPFTVSDGNYNTDGSYFFKSDNAVYDIKIVNGVDTTWIYDVTLYDVDEQLGTFNPAFVSGSGTITINTSLDTLYYTKRGSWVHIQGQIRVLSVSAPSGSLRITGLPFTSASDSETPDNFGFSIVPNNLGSSAVYPCCIVRANTTQIEVLDFTGTGTVDSFAGKCQAGTDFYLNFSYRV